MNKHERNTGPVTVNRKLHRGLVSIPFPDLPLPPKRAKPQLLQLPPEPIVAKIIAQEPQPVVTPKPKLVVGAPKVEEVSYPLPPATITDDVERIKDMGTYLEEPPEW